MGSIFRMMSLSNAYVICRRSCSCCHSRRCFFQSARMQIGRTLRSPIAARPCVVSSTNAGLVQLPLGVLDHMQIFISWAMRLRPSTQTRNARLLGGRIGSRFFALVKVPRVCLRKFATEIRQPVRSGENLPADPSVLEPNAIPAA